VDTHGLTKTAAFGLRLASSRFVDALASPSPLNLPPMSHAPARPTSAVETTTVEGQSAVRLSLPDGSTATVLLHGGHVISWQAAGHGEQLYTSPEAKLSELKTGQAVRGGVPVIFPQFELRGPDRKLPRHGFARTRSWNIDHQSTGPEHALVTLVLRDDATTRNIWPHAFELELTINLGLQRLDMELHIVNTGTGGTASVWPFAAALHTYLQVSDIHQARLQGLEGCHFIDALKADQGDVEDHPEKRFAGAMDRIYAHVPRQLLLRDGAKRMNIETEGFQDAVLWNPGPEQCAKMKDMPAEGWRQMLCVEAAQVMSPPTLAAGESWTGRQSLVLPSE